MRIIGIDPGTATTGFSILEKKDGKIRLLEYGCIRTAKSLSPATRLNHIATDLETLIKKWHPTHSSIEKLFFNKNVKTAISVAEARGVILQTFARYDIPQEEFTPHQIKQAVCGYGKADKKMVQKMIQLLLKLKEIPKPDDAADAIAAAICSANTLKIK